MLANKLEQSSSDLWITPGGAFPSQKTELRWCRGSWCFPLSEEQWGGERISAADANPVEENGLVVAEKRRKQADEDDNLVDELHNHG